MTPLFTFINKAVVNMQTLVVADLIVLYNGENQQFSVVSVNRRDFVVPKKCRLHILPNASLHNTAERGWNKTGHSVRLDLSPDHQGLLGIAYPKIKV